MIEKKGVRLSFCRGEGIVWEKMISTSFDKAADYGKRAPGVWAVRPLRGADPSATKRLCRSNAQANPSAT
jgi:hypothetical protein